MVGEQGQSLKRTQKNNLQLDDRRGLDMESKGEYKTKDEYICYDMRGIQRGKIWRYQKSVNKVCSLRIYQSLYLEFIHFLSMCYY